MKLRNAMIEALPVLGIALFLLAAFAALGWSAEPCSKKILESSLRTNADWTVVSNHDGDTVTLEDTAYACQVNVRIFGIDTPELKQEGGQAAQAALQKLLAAGAVSVSKPHKRVQWNNDRPVLDLYVHVRKGKAVHTSSVSVAMARAGMAWWYEKYAPKRSDIAEAEQSARAKRIGIWAAENPTPPWEWRRNPRKAARKNVK